MPLDIPGYIYDQEKNRYFKLEARKNQQVPLVNESSSSTSPSSADPEPYSLLNLLSERKLGLSHFLAHTNLSLLAQKALFLYKNVHIRDAISCRQCLALFPLRYERILIVTTSKVLIADSLEDFENDKFIHIIERMPIPAAVAKFHEDLFSYLAFSAGEKEFTMRFLKIHDVEESRSFVTSQSPSNVFESATAKPIMAADYNDCLAIFSHGSTITLGRIILEPSRATSLKFTDRYTDHRQYYTAVYVDPSSQFILLGTRSGRIDKMLLSTANMPKLVKKSLSVFYRLALAAPVCTIQRFMESWLISTSFDEVCAYFVI
jgi:hypothetical protein